MQEPKLSVVMPAYNEEKTICDIINKVLKQQYIHEIIVVNDCSKDKTLKVLEVFEANAKVKVVNHERNMGKTAALITGFEHITGNLVIIQDADMEYNPDEYKYLLEPILENQADVVYGSRFLVRKAHRVCYFYHYVANRFLTFFLNCFTNFNMTDVETCYKCFKAPLIKNMIITSTGFGFEIEVTAKISKTSARVYEVPISYYGRSYEEGKKIGLKDGVAALFYVFKYNIFTGFKSSFKKDKTEILKEMLPIVF